MIDDFVRPAITRRLVVGAAGALGVGLGRASGAEPPPSDALVREAKSEGVVAYYHNSDIDTTGRWTAAFTKKYGVPTKNMRLPSYPLYDRWLNEERVGRHVADLIQITDPTLLSAAAKQGFIANYTPGRRRAGRSRARRKTASGTRSPSTTWASATTRRR